MWTDLPTKCNLHFLSSSLSLSSSSILSSSHKSSSSYSHWTLTFSPSTLFFFSFTWEITQQFSIVLNVLKNHNYQLTTSGVHHLMIINKLFRMDETNKVQYQNFACFLFVLNEKLGTKFSLNLLPLNPKSIELYEKKESQDERTNLD